MIRTVRLPETLDEELERHARYAGLAPEEVINAALADYLRPRIPRRRAVSRTSASSENQQEQSAEARVARMQASLDRMALFLPDLPVISGEATRRENFYEERD